MDIIGSKAQGEKITAKVGGNLNIETLQEKETYEEQNKSAGFGISWGIKAKDKQTSTKSTGQTQNPRTLIRCDDRACIHCVLAVHVSGGGTTGVQR